MLAHDGKRYGEGIIEDYSLKLMKEIGKNCNERTLRRIRQFYLVFKEEKWSPVASK